MERIMDINIESFTPVLSPDSLIQELPLSEPADETVSCSGNAIRDIMVNDREFDIWTYFYPEHHSGKKTR